MSVWGWAWLADQPGCAGISWVSCCICPQDVAPGRIYLTWDWTSRALVCRDRWSQWPCSSLSPRFALVLAGMLLCGVFLRNNLEVNWCKTSLCFCWSQAPTAWPWRTPTFFSPWDSLCWGITCTGLIVSSRWLREWRKWMGTKGLESKAELLT